MTYIFDLDGTLINSSSRHIILLKRIIQEYNISEDAYELLDDYLEYKAKGYSTIRFLKEIIKLSDEQASYITTEWISHIEDEDLLLSDVLYSDAIEVLEALKDNTIIFVSSRNNEYNALKECKRLNLDCYAAKIFITDPKKGLESKVEVFKRILWKYGRELIVVGDTEVDYSAANRINSKFYILNRGFRSKIYWGEKVVLSFSNLYGLLGGKI